MVTLQCRKCSHSFEKDRIPLNCPFCGAKESVKPVPSAGQLLIDAGNEEKSFFSRQKKDA